MQLNFASILENISTILLLLLALGSIKIAVIFSILKFEVDTRVSLKSALSLFQLGEFGLVVFELSSANGLISHDLSQIFIATIILSMVVTPFVLKNIASIVDNILRTKAKINYGNSISCHDKLSDHIVLIGYGKLGHAIATLLEDSNIAYIAIDQNIRAVEDATKEGKNIIFGNSTKNNILESASIKDSIAVIVAVEHSDRLYMICQAIQSMKKDANIILKVNRFEEQEFLSDLGLTHIIVETEQTALSMYDELIKFHKKDEIDIDAYFK
jgi:CPA2 family monovalent cation:H+ antiporter-2